MNKTKNKNYISTFIWLKFQANVNKFDQPSLSKHDRLLYIRFIVEKEK